MKLQYIKSYEYLWSGYTVVIWGYMDRQTNIHGEILWEKFEGCRREGAAGYCTPIYEKVITQSKL